MSLSVRIADIPLTLVANPAPSFGSLLDASGRSVSFAAKITGATKDTLGAAISALNTRLALPCDLVIQSTGSTYPMALRLLGNGEARVADQWDYEFVGGQSVVQIDAPCAPYATPANRVFLASPIGDEFPVDTTVIRNSAARVYARDGRYVVTTDTTDEGELWLSFECVDNELLVIEFDWECETIAGVGNGMNINAHLPDGAAFSNATTFDLVDATSSGTGGHFIGTVLVSPSTPSKTGYLLVTSYNHAGAMRAYIWNVKVGVKQSVAAAVVNNDFRDNTLPTGWGNSTSVVNYVPYPSYEIDTNSDGLANGVSVYSSTITGAPTNICGVSTGRDGVGKAQRLRYTSPAGDSSAKTHTLQLAATAVGSFAGTDPATASFYYKGTLSGVTATAKLLCFTSGGVYIAESAVTSVLTLTGSWQRVSLVKASCPATTSYIVVTLEFSAIINGDTIDAYMDDAMVTKTAAATAIYFDGDTTGAVWAGTADASTSTFYYGHVDDQELHVEADAAVPNTYQQGATFAAVAGRRYGAGAWVEVTAANSASFSAAIQWRDAVGTSTGGATISVLAGITADTWYQVDAIAPAGTVTGQFTFSWWDTPAGACAAIVHGLEFGQHLIEKPGIIRLDAIESEINAPLHVIGDIGLKLDAHIFGAGVAEADDEAYLIEAETLTTTAGGATVWGADVASAKLSGGHGRSSASTSYVPGYFDTSKLRSGLYRLLAKGYEGTGGQTASFYCPATGTTVTETGQNAVWLDLGTISIPAARTRTGTASYAYIQMKTSGGLAVCDCLYLLPHPAMLYHPATSTEDATTIELEPDATVYLDNAVNMTSVVPARLSATKRDALHVLCDRNSDDYAATHDARVSIYAEPRFSLLR